MRTYLTSLLLCSLLSVSTPGCAAYERHPTAVGASVAALALAPVGVGIGIVGGDADTWSGQASHDGIAQLSVLAIMVASTVIALCTPEPEPPAAPSAR